LATMLPWSFSLLFFRVFFLVFPPLLPQLLLLFLPPLRAEKPEVPRWTCYRCTERNPSHPSGARNVMRNK
jgi:hypothetical protein